MELDWSELRLFTLLEPGLADIVAYELGKTALPPLIAIADAIGVEACRNEADWPAWPSLD